MQKQVNFGFLVSNPISEENTKSYFIRDLISAYFENKDLNFLEMIATSDNLSEMLTIGISVLCIVSKCNNDCITLENSEGFESNFSVENFLKLLKAGNLKRLPSLIILASSGSSEKIAEVLGQLEVSVIFTKVFVDFTKVFELYQLQNCNIWPKILQNIFAYIIKYNHIGCLGNINFESCSFSMILARSVVTDAPLNFDKYCSKYKQMKILPFPRNFGYPRNFLVELISKLKSCKLIQVRSNTEIRKLFLITSEFFIRRFPSCIPVVLKFSQKSLMQELSLLLSDEEKSCDNFEHFTSRNLILCVLGRDSSLLNESLELIKQYRKMKIIVFFE